MARFNAAIFAGLLLAVQGSALKVEKPVKPTTKITAPNAPSTWDDHTKASKAITKYMGTSKGTLEAWNDVVDTKKVAPATYPARLDDLAESQKGSIKDIESMKKAAKKASDLAEKEKGETKTKYEGKDKDLDKARKVK